MRDVQQPKQPDPPLGWGATAFMWGLVVGCVVLAACLLVSAVAGTVWVVRHAAGGG